MARNRNLHTAKVAKDDEFEATYNIIHSDAYTVYGCKRTGCAGCPFAGHFEDELTMLRQHEPKLANAVEHIFAPSYEYIRAYRIFGVFTEFGGLNKIT